MAKESGVFSLMLGNRLVVVINGVQAIRETIIKRSIAFAGRSKLHTFNLANLEESSLSFGDYSPRWNLTRNKFIIDASPRYIICFTPFLKLIISSHRKTFHFIRVGRIAV